MAAHTDTTPGDALAVTCEPRLLPFRIPPKSSRAESRGEDQHFVDLLQAAFFISEGTTRREKEVFIQGLIDLLDVKDGDPDMEPDGDSEDSHDREQIEDGAEAEGADLWSGYLLKSVDGSRPELKEGFDPCPTIRLPIGRGN